MSLFLWIIPGVILTLAMLIGLLARWINQPQKPVVPNTSPPPPPGPNPTATPTVPTPAKGQLAKTGKMMRLVGFVVPVVVILISVLIAVKVMRAISDEWRETSYSSSASLPEQNRLEPTISTVGTYQLTPGQTTIVYLPRGNNKIWFEGQVAIGREDGGIVYSGPFDPNFSLPDRDHWLVTSLDVAKTLTVTHG